MHGLGNDFIVIDAINQPVSLTTKQIALWSDRRYGVGFDQLLLVEKSTTESALFSYRIFNADGSEVAQCGNGARCFARFVREKGLTDAAVIPVETRGGPLMLKVIDTEQVEVNMGIPQFEPSSIPLMFDRRKDKYQIDINGQTVEFSALSIGNPHAVLLVDDVETAAVETLGSALQSHSIFPHSVNVGFMEIKNRDVFKLRVFERGAGETLACGSGACAAMVAGNQSGFLHFQATAQLPGGLLKLGWQGEGKPVIMTGSTAMVYEGEINL